MAIFGSTSPTRSRVYQVGAARATIGGTPAILLGVQVTIARQLSPVPTLTDGVVWSAQPVQGSLQAQSIVTQGKTGQLISQLAEKGLCDPLVCRIEMGDGGCDNAGTTLVIKDGYCSSVTFSASGSQGYIGNDFTIQFTICEFTAK